MKKRIRWYSDVVHLIMLSLQHVEIGSKQTNQSMNRMIAQVIKLLMFALPIRKIWYLSGKFDQHRMDWDIGSCESLVRYDFQNLLTIVAQFLQNTLENSYIFYPI